VDGEKQIVRSTIIDARPDAVWEVLGDSRLLPDWAPVVDKITECSFEGEAVGEVRHCDVTLAGKSGRMVERCVEFVPMTRIAWVVDDESFGMQRMFEHYGFALNLEPFASGQTRVILETHYTPRNPMYGLLNRLLIRRRFEKVCEGILGGLKTFTESRQGVRPTGYTPGGPTAALETEIARRPGGGRISASAQRTHERV
jgi:uncharacterized protein YndB with AHSA1/START domain